MQRIYIYYLFNIISFIIIIIIIMIIMMMMMIDIYCKRPYQVKAYVKNFIYKRDLHKF